MRTLLIGYDGGLGSAVSFALQGEVIDGAFDVRDEDAIYDLVTDCAPFNAIVYCAGVNKISKFDDLDEKDFWESMDVNCFGFVRVIRMLFETNTLAPWAKACLVTSNAANIPMSHSLSYNCSKAAANMLIRQMAREIPVKTLMIFGVAPNKLAGTPMSRDIDRKVCEMRGWSLEEAREYQLAALPAKTETSVYCCAAFIATLMGQRHDYYLHGTILPYGGPQ